MEILKTGKSDWDDLSKVFKCNRCGCEFRANSNEYETAFFHMNGLYYECKCPCCKNKVYIEE